MAKLLFYDPTHTYTLDGEVIPSVSEITRFMSREIYGDLQQNTLDRAAGRGSAVHKATEVLDKYGTVEASDDIVPYVRAYVQFLREHSVEWEMIEHAVVSPEQDYAGTLDRYGTVDGKKTLADIKAISAMTPGHRKLYEATLNLYRICVESGSPVERLLIIWLRKDGTYKLFDIPIDGTLAEACRALHRALRKKPRKKKETKDNAE